MAVKQWLCPECYTLGPEPPTIGEGRNKFPPLRCLECAGWWAVKHYDMRERKR